MGRPRSAPVYEVGPVRITKRGSGYRLRWMELGVERERTAADFDVARALADSVAARLALATGEAVSGAAAFGALCEAWIDAHRSEWGAAHATNMAILVGERHIGRKLGKLACDRVTDRDLRDFLDGMAKEGYSKDWIGTAARLLRSVGRYGVTRRVWASEHDPARGLRLPKLDRTVDRTLIPSPDQVAALADAAETSTEDEVQGLRRRWMIRAAAGCGLRWGEMCVLRASDVNLDERTVEVVRAWHPKEPPDRRLGPPKSDHSVRTVVIPEDDLDLWRRVIDAAEDGCFLAKPARGQVWSGSYWSNKVWPRLTADIEGWPEGAGYHYLRHFAIVSWLNAGVPLGDVSGLAGHHSSDFTMKRYVGPSRDYIEQARRLL